MPFCGKCGAETKETDRFCGECGAQTQNVAAQQEKATVFQSQIPAQSLANREYSSVGIRFLAQFIDGLILFAPLLVVFLSLGYLIGNMTGNITEDGSFELHGLPALFVMATVFLMGVFYFTIMEAYRDGQTVGKKLTRIQVVTADNSPLTFKISLIRNIFRIADGLLFYLVGAVFVWTSHKRQRLGDRMANTYVVSKKPKDEKPPQSGSKSEKKIKFALFSNRDETVFIDTD